MAAEREEADERSAVLDLSREFLMRNGWCFDSDVLIDEHVRERTGCDIIILNRELWALYREITGIRPRDFGPYPAAVVVKDELPVWLL